MQAQVVGQSGPGIAKVGLVDAILKDDLSQGLQSFVLCYHLVQIFCQLPSDGIKSAGLQCQLIHGVVEEGDAGVLGQPNSGTLARFGPIDCLGPLQNIGQLLLLF